MEICWPTVVSNGFKWPAFGTHESNALQIATLTEKLTIRKL